MFQPNRIGFLFVFLILSFFLFFIIFGDQGFIDLFQLQTEYHQLCQYSSGIEQENVNLHRLIKRLKYDPEYVERIARSEIGMIRKNETILKFSRRKP